MTQFDAIAFGKDRNDVTRLYVTLRRDGKYKAQYVYSGGTRVNKVIDAEKLAREQESGRYRVIGAVGSLLTVKGTPTAEAQTFTPACPRDTGIVGGCGMVDQPMLRDVPPATTDERFFKVVR